MAEQKATPNGKTMLTVVQFLLPVVMGIVFAYGTVKYAAGEITQKLADLERRIEQNKRDIERSVERGVSKELYEQFLRYNQENFDSIKEDFRRLRR